MTLNLIASTTHWIGLLVYGLILTGFGVALTIRPGHRAQDLKRFQSLGSLLGLSMGALIFGGIGSHLLRYGLHWPEPGGADGVYLLAKYGVFLLLWVSSFHLEIWTLEALRRTATSPGESGPISLPAVRQIQFNAVLFHLVGLLSWLHRT